MKLFMLEPEVAGEMGSNTVYDNYDEVRDNGAYPKISYLHFVFLGWLGDDILESTPCFIVTEKLMERIKESKLSGCKFEKIEISLSDEFNEMYPGRKIPNFVRIIPTGNIKIENNTYTDWTGEDFNLSDKLYLVVSQKALDIIKDFNMDNCDVYELNKK